MKKQTKLPRNVLLASALTESGFDTSIWPNPKQAVGPNFKNFLASILRFLRLSKGSRDQPQAAAQTESSKNPIFLCLLFL